MSFAPRPDRPAVWPWLIGLLTLLFACQHAGAYEGQARIERISVAVVGDEAPLQGRPPLSGWQPLSGAAYVAAYVAGYSDRTHWLKLHLLIDRPGSLVLTVLPTFLDRVDLWLPESLADVQWQLAAEGGMVVKRQGDHVPALDRDSRWRGFSFRLEAREAGSAVVHLRVSSSSSLLVYPELFAPSGFTNRIIAESLLLGLLVGIMVILGFYAVLHWWAERERVIALHAGFAASSLLYLIAFSGLWSTYVLPAQAQDGIEWLGLFAAIQNFSGCALIRRVFALDQLCRPVDWFVRVTMMAFPLFALFALFGQWALIARWSATLMTVQLLVVTATVLLTWRRHEAMAPSIAVAYILVILSFLMPLSALLGANLPAWMLLYAGQVSNTLLLLLMVPVVTHRVHQIRLARDRAALDAERHAQELQLQMETMQERREWMAMLAHEIKTPLSVIEASNHNIRVIAADEHVLARSAKITRGTRQLKALIATLFLEDGEGRRHRQPNLVPVYPARVVRSLVTELPVDERQRIGVSLDESVHVMADPLLLQIALNNLLVNALRHSDQGARITLTVSHEVLPEGQGAAIRVMDDGPAIAHELRQSLFERKGRFGHMAGSGIGLWACRQIAAAHQGAVRWSAPPGKERGNIFELWLPLQPGTP